MNSERRIQRVRKVIEPVQESRTDWEIACLVAQAMGKGASFAFQSAEAIWNEIRSVWPAGAGITYRRLEAGGLQWPCPQEEHPGTIVLHTDIFAHDHRVRLRHIDFRPTQERTTAEFPFLLTTGRALYQFNAGTMTGRSRVADFQPVDLLQVSPQDARRLGISNGQMVWVRSRYGAVQLAARISQQVQVGELFATFQLPETCLNRLTSPYGDRFVQTPEYKITAVRLELAS